MAMSELKQRLLEIELSRIGFRYAQYAENLDLVKIDLSNDRMPRIYDNGDIHYGSEYNHLVRHQIQPIVDRVNEIIAAWENSHAIPIEKLSDFRIMAEYNDVVLAARDDTILGFDYGFEFVTWKYNRDRTAMDYGNYTADYEAAKQDFAIRCGLVDRHKLFNESEMKLIYQGLVHLGADFPNLTAEQNTLLGKVVERIEMLVPEIREHEELEHSELVPDDGLEV